MTDETFTPPPSVAIRGSQGVVLVRVGLIFTVYFANGFDLAGRAAVRECSRLFLELCGKKLKWIGLDDTEQWDRIGPGTLQSWNDFLGSTAGEYDYCLQLRGGQNPQEATEYQFLVMANQRTPPTNCSYLTIDLPANHPSVTFEAFTHQKLWVSLLPELARLLKPIRFECLDSFDAAAPHRFTLESTNAWLARFENPPPWE